MKSYEVKSNSKFVGRKYEFDRLDEIHQESRPEAKFIIVYGKRRIGKTELVEQYFRDRMIWKIEGTQLDRKKRDKRGRRDYQFDHALRQLAGYKENSSLRGEKLKYWSDFFELVDTEAKKMDLVLFFEEVQWLADYENDFFSEMKRFWDGGWRNNPKLTLVICGSSTSFIIQSLIKDQAMYSRGENEFNVKELSLQEVAEYLNVGWREALLAQLIFGGVIGYIKQLTGNKTIFNEICDNSFVPNARFLNEYDKIFVSRMSNNKHYKRAIECVALNKYRTLEQVNKFCNPNSKGVGGEFLSVMEDLEDSDFVEKYNPFDKGVGSKLVRYKIKDEYLHFYYNFIYPNYYFCQN